MAVIHELMELIDAFESVGIPLPNYLIAIILILILLVIIIEIFKKFINYGKNVIKAIETRFYNRETMQFIKIRKNFVDHLVYEVQRLNREADWNDFQYTELEAEVEVDRSLDLDISLSKNPIVWISSLCQIVKNSIGISPTLKVQKNLIQAIMSSKSRSFLIIGDPGSGKTVSLRHLFLEMAGKCSSSKDKAAVVPIYLNLKHLDVEPDEVNADRICDWIIEQLRADQDRTIHEFLDKNFKQMLKSGAFFFLFDSFDEIPAVIDAQQEQKVVRQYAGALDRFLHSQHQCRGLVSSRPYRSPKIFMGLRMTIRPLSNKRIKKALYKYMVQEMALADQVWQELVQSRDDMLYIAQNPFYLGLLARYVKENQKLPDRHYDLFEHFVQTRAHTDEERLRHLGLTPDELVERASILAFAMTRTSHIGLEVNVDHVREVTISFNETSSWDPDAIEPLLNALAYSKLGRISQAEPGNPSDFSFVHRRFHEYFCARYLKQNPNIAPFENLAADDRWREILVLLCEVLPVEHLTMIFDTARLVLKPGINADSGSIEHRKAIEAIRFLRDGFRSRIEDLPIDIRVMCSKFIQRQLESGHLLDQKRAIEGVSIADDESAPAILESALTSDSAWLRETAIRSCRILRHIPQQIAEAIRHHIYHRYTDLKIRDDYNATYSVLFSSPPILRPFRSFSKILKYSTLSQVAIYVLITLYALRSGIGIFLALLFCILVAVLYINYTIPHINPPNIPHDVNPRQHHLIGRISLRIFEVVYSILRPIMRLYFKNPWILLPMIMLYTTMILIVQIQHDLFFWMMVFFSMSLLLIFNILLGGLVSDYPRSRSAWFVYPMIKLKKMLTGLIKFCMDCWKEVLLTILFFVSIILSSIVLSSWLEEAADIARSQSYSISNIYSAHGFILGTFVVFTLLLIAIFVLSVNVIFCGAVMKFIFNFMKILSDQFKLKKISLLSDSRPSTATEAIQILHSFKSDVGKAQYIHALFKWLPAGTDPQVLIEEANKHHSVVSERLYQLAEIWEDSLQGNR